MAINNLLTYSAIWICFISLLLKNALCIDKELPSFEYLPPHIQYYSSSDSQIELRCQVWPKSAKIHFVISSRKQWRLPVDDPSKSMSVSPLDRNIGERVSQGHLKITNQIHLTQIQDQDIHCLTGTDFATILSRPFRITRAGISDFGSSANTKTRTVTKTFLKGNVAVIDCWPPESHPKAIVKFTFNDIDIKEGGRYRFVTWSEEKRVSLLIASVDQSDNGLYRCSASNTFTHQTKLSTELIKLTVEIPSSSVSPSIVMPLSGRVSGPQLLTVRQGANVTLFCVMQGAPPPTTRIFNHNDRVKEARYSTDHAFGLLHIVNAQASDAGNYICSDTYLTSSAVLKVIEPLNITGRPADVVLDSLSGDATFVCEPSRPNVLVSWFFNGRPIPSALNNTSVRISAVTINSLGLYQCVIQDRDEWASAAATLSIKSYKLVVKSGSRDPIGDIKAPIAQNIDNDGQILTAPSTRRILDNLAVYLFWSLHTNNLGPITYYVLEVAQLTDDVTKQQWNELNRQWTVPPVAIQEKINVSYYYVTSRYLQPQASYQFRVHALFESGHSLTSTWSKPVRFLDIGTDPPVLEEVEKLGPTRMAVRWAYHNSYNWPVDTFRVLYRLVLVNATESSKKFSKPLSYDVAFPMTNVTLDNLEPGGRYQLIVYGLHTGANTKTTTRFSLPMTVDLPAVDQSLETTTLKPSGKFLSGLIESWKSNKVLYGSLFALTGLMLLIMILLLLLCLCRQRQFRTNKGMGSTNAFPYNYKEVSKTSSAAAALINNNSSSTLQIPGRMPQHSGSQLGLGMSSSGQPQYQLGPSNGSLSRRNTDTASQIYRAGSVQGMETASLVTDLYGAAHNYSGMHGLPMGGSGGGHHMQHPYQGFSTLQPQGYMGGHGRSAPQYQHYLQQQQQQHHQQQLRDNPAVTDQNMEMVPRGMNPSHHQQQQQQQHLSMMMQQQQQQQQQSSQQDPQRHNMGYYNQRQGAMSPQMMLMMMGSQQSLANSAQYRRSNSQNYSVQSVETPIAINPSGHPIYQMDQVLVDSTGRPLSPQYHYMPQQQTSHTSQMHPAMMDMYNQQHAFSRPIVAEYQQSLNRQQYRRSDSDCGTHEPGYSYLSAPHGTEIVSSRQPTLNSLPEQPIDNNNHDQQSSPGPNHTSNNNNNSSGRHHHRRKTRSRQANTQEPASLERSQAISNHNDIPPMLAPRSKLPYSEHQGMHRLSGHDMNTIDSHENVMLDCNSESNTTGAVSDNFDPPLQYSGHYDTNESKYRMDCNMDMNDNEATPSNSLLIDNLPRVRDVSEYGIPINNNSSHHSMKQAPVPPLKSANHRHNHPPVPNNGYNLDCNPDYYSSATSSDRSGPSPPPKYAPGVVLPARSDEMYIRDQRDQIYYHGDTHC